MPLIHTELVEKMIAETAVMTEQTKNAPGMETPDAMADYLSKINAFLARSGEINATAKLLLQEQVRAVRDVREDDYKKMKATEAKSDIQYRTRRTEFLIDLSERLNHNLVHEGNNIRRQLQYLSDQMTTIR